MKSRIWPASLICIFIISSVQAQHIEMLTQKAGISLRGLSTVSEKVVWVSGNKGHVGRSVDGGKSWEWIIVPGYESKDFRDIEAFDSNTALIMAVEDPGLILKTTNGGKTWSKVYEKPGKGMFLDAMDFWNDLNGVVIGDPINGKFFIARTGDGGVSWKEIAIDKMPVAREGEACFAASGTNIRFIDRDEFLIVTGGKVSRLFFNNKSLELPVAQGKESQGANSIAVWNKAKSIVIVGGDFMADSIKTGNCIVSRNGGKIWIKPTSLPNGYRSCVEYIGEKKLITCGLNGVDISSDGGIHWNSISATGFHVCRKSKKGDAVFLAGGGGRIAKLVW